MCVLVVCYFSSVFFWYFFSDAKILLSYMIMTCHMSLATKRVGALGIFGGRQMGGCLSKYGCACRFDDVTKINLR